MKVTFVYRAPNAFMSSLAERAIGEGWQVYVFDAFVEGEGLPDEVSAKVCGGAVITDRTAYFDTEDKIGFEPINAYELLKASYEPDLWLSKVKEIVTVVRQAGREPVVSEASLGDHLKNVPPLPSDVDVINCEEWLDWPEERNRQCVYLIDHHVASQIDNQGWQIAGSDVVLICPCCIGNMKLFAFCLEGKFNSFEVDIPGELEEAWEALKQKLI